MLARLYVRRFARRLALAAVALTVLALLPGGPTGAQTQSEIQTLDDRQNEFARGSFQRTSLSAETNPISSNPADTAGAVLLAPVGFLNPWDESAVPLPEARANAGVVVLGNRLFAITGTGSGGSTDSAFWATVNQETGAIQPHGVAETDPRFADEFWLNDPLPAIEQNDECPGEVSQRTRAAVAGVSTGNNTGYIYVIGGVINTIDCTDFTSNAVQIGAVNAAGDIVWTQGPTLPSAPQFDGDTLARGVEGATATIVRTSANKTYLYVIGGLSTYNFFAPESAIEDSVFYTEIDTTTGSLRNPNDGGTTTPWARGPDVPVIDPSPATTDPVGLVDHTATAALTTVNSGAGTTLDEAIFVAGGFVDIGRSEINNFVYRADINPSNGALTWTTEPNTNGDEVTLEQGGIQGAASLAYNNKLYIIGGARTELQSSAYNKVLTAVFDDSLNLQRIPGGTEYFLGAQNTANVVGVRTDAGAALMDALPPADNPSGDLGSAWAWVVGGNDASGTPLASIRRGKIGGADEASESRRMVDGWYYSTVFNITITRDSQQKNARVLAIRWTTGLDRSANPNADIIVQFRKVLRSNPTCPDETVFSGSDPWFTLDGDTGSNFYSQPSTAGSPFNAVTLRDAFGGTDFSATCIQYRARLVQNGLDTNGQPVAPANPSMTPKLFNVSIEKVVAGNVDIRLKEFEIAQAANGGLARFDVTVRNLSLEGVENTVSAGLEDDGSFWVTLCAVSSPIGSTPPTLTPPTLPLADGTYPDSACPIQAFYPVYKAQMTPGAELLLQNSGPQQWLDRTTGQPVDDVRSFFCTPGNYAVAVLIDLWNYVPEGDAGEVNNRGEDINSNQPVIRTFTTSGCTNLINLPLIRR